MQSGFQRRASRTARFLIGWLLLFVPAPGGAQNTAAARPNFVFIISDDQRWDTLGAAGNKAVHTPVLDRLAREGAWFRQATIHIPQCAPSRATLLTGLPPHQHGYYSNQVQRPEAQKPSGFNRPVLPGLLRDAGYRTVLVGKWHVRPEPWNCGFSDVRVWMPGGAGPYRDARLAHGNSRQVKRATGFTNEIFADDAVAFLRGKEAAEKPFLLWLAYTEPHGPMRPVPERIRKLYAGKTEADLLPPGFPKGARARGGQWIDYYQAISHLDEQVGRVLSALEENKLAQNTVVVFLGDNGFMMGSRGLNGKVVPYEESIRVPLLIRAPRLPGARGRNDAAVSSLDLPPTFLKMAGLTPPSAWPGRDLTPVLRGVKTGFRDEAVCEWADEDNPKFGKIGYRVLRTPTHKLIRWEQPDKSDELYDLVRDPRETNNLAGSAAAASTKSDLLRRLKAWMDRTNDPARNWKKPQTAAGKELDD